MSIEGRLQKLSQYFKVGYENTVVTLVLQLDLIENMPYNQAFADFTKICEGAEISGVILDLNQKSLGGSSVGICGTLAKLGEAHGFKVAVTGCNDFTEKKLFAMKFDQMVGILPSIKEANLYLAEKRVD